MKTEEEVGLCATCKQMREVRSDRGSVFYQCLRAATDPRFRKYPALPLLLCPGYERQAEPSQAPDHSTQ